MVCAPYQNIGKKKAEARRSQQRKQITVDRKEKQGKELSPFVRRIKYTPQKSYSEGWLAIRKDSKTTKVAWVSTRILYITQDAHRVSRQQWHY